MVFKPNEDIDQAATQVYGYLNGKIKAPFPLSDNNACHNMQCPIKAGDSITYKNALFVEPLYPTIPVIVQWELHTGSDTVTCFTVPVIIVS
ncbi:ecdysteroid-regulated 16 kDa protein [Aplysia californica]|uniref:Ecdysteroid-regulated 16 kDa protein n=1 Tax=Aplysia californica TaxID=6500 RepID=A0ABM0ZZF4_APLCA|nr:ecdysteroid-regulated 16 kDa protein [Aplysia californica]